MKWRLVVPVVAVAASAVGCSDASSSPQADPGQAVVAVPYYDESAFFESPNETRPGK